MKSQPSLFPDTAPSAMMELPQNLRTEAFVAVWNEWQKWRSESRHKLKPMTARRQLRKLSAIGEARAIATLELSLDNGYLGLFPEKTAVNGKTHAAPLWQQIKAIEEQIAAVDKQLMAIPSYPQSVYPKEFALTEAKRRPLRERKAQLKQQLAELKAKQAGGV